MNNNNLILLTFLVGSIFDPIKGLRLFQKPFECGKCNNCSLSKKYFDSEKSKLDFKLINKSDYDLIWEDYLNDPNPPVRFETYNMNFTNYMDRMIDFEFHFDSKY